MWFWLVDNREPWRRRCARPARYRQAAEPRAMMPTRGLALTGPVGPAEGPGGYDRFIASVVLN